MTTKNSKPQASSSSTAAEEIVSRIRKERDDLQNQLQKLSGFTWKSTIGFWLFSALYIWLIGYSFESSAETYIQDWRFWLWETLGAYLIGLLLYFGSSWFLRYFLRLQIESKDTLLTGAGIKKLQDNLEDDFVTNLVKLNLKYIDQYYEQTQAHANKSFLLSLVVAVLGFAIIGIGIFMVFQGKTEPAYVTTAGGVISEFIAAVFFYLYNRTVIKMSEYHRKLVLTQNVSLALKISETLPKEEKVKAQQELVSRLSQDINAHLMQQDTEHTPSSPAA